MQVGEKKEKILQFNILKRCAKTFILGMLNKVGSAMVVVHSLLVCNFPRSHFGKKSFNVTLMFEQPSKSSGRKFVFSSIKNKMTHCLLKCFWQNFHTSSHDDCYARSSCLFLYFHLAWEQKSGVILTSTEPNFFRMLFSIKNVVGLLYLCLAQKTCSLHEILTRLVTYWKGLFMRFR